MSAPPPRLPVPDGLARRLEAAHGEAGRRFVETLPERVREAATRWELRVERPFPRLAYAWVAPVRGADGAPAVLKAAPPTPALHAEITALRAFDGRGAARLLAADAAEGLLLLERVEPGTPLAHVRSDDDATRAAAALMRRLWREPPPDASALPTLERLCEGLTRLRRRFPGGGAGPLPAALVERAEAWSAELAASAPPPRLLHGDLHHGNVLAARRDGWLAIDPKGVVGDPGWEVAALLRNPIRGLGPPGRELLARPDPARILARRLDLLAETLGHDRERLRRHALVGAVLSAWWHFEDHGEPGHEALWVAAALAERIGGGGAGT